MVRSDAQIGVDARAVAGGQIDRRCDHRAAAMPQRNAVVVEDGQPDVRMTVPVRGPALDGTGRRCEQRNSRCRGRKRSQKSSHVFSPFEMDSVATAESAAPAEYLKM